MTLEFPLSTRRATIHLARSIGPLLQASDLLILTGSLGAGKTFFTRALCRALGLPERERVTSPTFALVQEYPTQPGLVHADLYRLSSAQDVQRLGLDAYRDDGWLLVVEWGEPFSAVLGGDALVLELSVEPRVARLRATGSRSEQLLGRLGASLPRSPSLGVPNLGKTGDN